MFKTPHSPIVAILWASFACGAAAQRVDETSVAEVLGSDACRKCHEAEVLRWEATPHALTIDQLHRKPEAKAIAAKLGIRSVKRNDLCVRCHYTRRDVGGKVRIDSGVSCESCHGAARDWLDPHADYGQGATRETETAEHRADRRARSIALGMNNPSNLYLIARQCLDCHTTPDERLVDVGGHPPGSTGFDLVAWSQGTVRHNYVRSNGASNDVSSPDRLRLMHVVGLMADLEYSLRAVAGAEAAGPYATASAARAAAKKQTLWEIQRAVDHPLIAPALQAVAQVELKLDNSAAIIDAADAVGDAAMAFAEQASGADLGSVDRWLPDTSQYK